jgi:hypothetical protein
MRKSEWITFQLFLSLKEKHNFFDIILLYNISFYINSYFSTPRCDLFRHPKYGMIPVLTFRRMYFIEYIL